MRPRLQQYQGATFLCKKHMLDGQSCDPEWLSQYQKYSYKNW